MDDGPHERHLESLVERSRAGDRAALEQLARAIQDRIYGLALRMLGDPAEAEEATQEILIKVVTRLDSYRGESRFTTWVYAVAANHLRTMQARGLERLRPSFQGLVERQRVVLEPPRPPTAEHAALEHEVRLICLHVLLVCLDREHRLAYLLGEVLELDGVQGAQVLGIQPAAFRKRLSRARRRLRSFLGERCGLIHPSNPCHCQLRIELEVVRGRIDPGHTRFVDHPRACTAELGPADQDGLDEIERIDALVRSMPPYRAPDRLVDELTALLTRKESPPWH